MQKKETNEVDLMQCYVSNPSPTTPIRVAHLPLDLQAFTRTPSFSLGLCFPEQTKHNPILPIPNLNIMVELPLGVTTRSEITHTGEGRKQENT